MPSFWLAVPSVALVVLGAHFYRAGSGPLVALTALLLLLMLAWPRAWVARAVQLALVLGALEWIWTLVVLVQARLAFGQPWLRLSLILGVVAVATAAAGLVFRQSRLRERFRLR